ncbi:MAG: ABC transporter [Clostridiales bacterium 38-18]|nr:MAG: ABC transporter [Clostridiales bacterium 38-18]
MINSQDCSLTYKDGTDALKPFCLKIDKGEVVVILGASGSGKTSFLKLLLGIEKPTTGSLEVLGNQMSSMSTTQIRKLRMHIGPIFQDFRLIEGRTVLDNVLLGIRFLEIPKRERTELTLTSVERVGIQHKLNQVVDYLSWGERQRVAIARALARKPNLIIADEPTGNLDHDNAINVLNLLSNLAGPETTVIITTHAAHLIDEIPFTQIITIKEGLMEVKKSDRK